MGTGVSLGTGTSLIIEHIALRELAAVLETALVEELRRGVRKPWTTPCARIGYEYPALAVWEILDEGACSGEGSRPGPSLFRIRIVPTERIPFGSMVCCHIVHGI